MYISFSVVVCLLYQITRLQAEGRDLVYFKEEKTWLQAKKACSECGGQLVDWNETVSEIVSNSNLQNMMTWIGNYTMENPMIVEKDFKTYMICYLNILNDEYLQQEKIVDWISNTADSCIKESDVGDVKYNIIYHNSPEFCSRICRTDQWLGLKGEHCWCIDSYKKSMVKPCAEMPSGQPFIKVNTIGYVYTCDFENYSCTNTSFGGETTGLTWRRTIDNGAREIGNVGVDKGHYLLLEYLTTTIKNKARFDIRLNLKETYFCMTFKYYMNHGGSLEVFVNEPSIGNHIVWKKYGSKGHMWYSSSFDIKGHSDLTVEILGSIEDNNLYFKTSIVAIDEIQILPGSCNKEKRFDCIFDTGCEWEQRSSWDIVKETNGNYYLETLGKNALYELIGFGINRHIATTYCLQFDYFKYNWNGELYVNQNETQLFDEQTSDADEWLTKSIDIKAKYPYYIKFNGTTNNDNIRFDNISLRSGTCYKDTMMLVNNLNDWENDGKLPVKECDDNCFRFDNSEMKKNSVYTLTSPSIPITSTTMFCLTFDYWSYLREHGSLRLTTLINGIYGHDWESLQINWKWHSVAISIVMRDDFKIVIQVVRKSDRNDWSDVKIKGLKLMSGKCGRGTDNFSMGPMCPLVDCSDSSRLSVGYCSKMKKQGYLCQLTKEESRDSRCKNGIKIVKNMTDVKTTTMTSLQNVESSSSISTLNQGSSLTLKKTTSSNLNVTNSASLLKGSEHTGAKTGLAVVTGVLGVLVMIFMLFTVCLCMKIRRYHQGSGKEKAGLERVLSIQNRGHQMTSSGTSEVPLQTTASATEYELASPNHLKRRRDENQYDSLQNVHQSEPHSDYQNCDIFTSKKRHESQVYQEMEEGNYDHLRKSAERRKNFNSKGDNLYDHGQPVNSQNNDMYDKSKTGTGENYIVLEPENYASRESEIYDHAISNTFRKF